ncbi:MAG: PEP-CTERM sorting domain-containing protein [Verrucomicrobia bacterium]|jgi:hypothetical protein|nr:PEP-CTERM sorting domain-containing protein [Verrucomicrobiota bacterium]
MKRSFFLITCLIASFNLSKAQSFNIIIEPGAIKDTTGTVVGRSAGFTTWYAQTNFDTESLGAIFDTPKRPTLEQISQLSAADLSWSPLDATSASGFEFWETPGAATGNFLPRESSLADTGEVRPIVAIFDADDLDSLVEGSSFGLLIGSNFIGNLGPFSYQWPSNDGAFDISVGEPGSIQLVQAVPEPSSFAALAGVMTLGLVMMRRRRA